MIYFYVSLYGTDKKLSELFKFVGNQIINNYATAIYPKYIIITFDS